MASGGGVLPLAGPTAFVDVRERDLAPLLAPWPTKQLPVGDIWIGLSGEEVGRGGVVAERKTTDDFEASILDGRYREQRTRLTTYCQQQGARPLYIIEGMMDRLWGKLTAETMQKYLNRLMLRYGVAVIHTDSVGDTAKVCKLLATQIAADPAVFQQTDPAAVSYTSTVSVTKKGNKEDPRNFASCALQGCPGVSAAIAEAVLTAFGGSLKGVLDADEAALAAVTIGGGGAAAKQRRVGPAVAKRLFNLLHS
jgi:ERCC4-type nuclease